MDTVPTMSITYAMMVLSAMGIAMMLLNDRWYNKEALRRHRDHDDMNPFVFTGIISFIIGPFVAINFIIAQTGLLNISNISYVWLIVPLAHGIWTIYFINYCFSDLFGKFFKRLTSILARGV